MCVDFHRTVSLKDTITSFDVISRPQEFGYHKVVYINLIMRSELCLGVLVN